MTVSLPRQDVSLAMVKVSGRRELITDLTGSLERIRRSPDKLGGASWGRIIPFSCSG